MSFAVRDQIFFICGVFTVLSAQNTIVCVDRWVKNNKLMEQAQLFASANQLANTLFLTCFIGLPASSFGNTVNGCYLWSAGTCFFYFSFQEVSASILIFRATLLMKGIWQVVARIFGFALLLASFSSVLAGVIMQPTFIDANGFCVVSFNWNNTNDIGKQILLVLYILILLCFLIPLIGHVVQVSKTMANTPGKGMSSIKRIATAGTVFGVRTCLAILGFLVPHLFPLIFGGNSSWGGLQGLSFVLQNYFALVASTIPDKAESMNAPAVKGFTRISAGKAENLSNNESKMDRTHKTEPRA
ncbi:hypothetical protein BC830DRAFT_1118231 [Chytriomyces sp. MP71]|nr:hypothetical protein BC830DRAFT_1118231 [Chytriomyces sp. MP71]